VGYYDEGLGSQRWPFPVGLLYPERGDSIEFIGNLGSHRLIWRCVQVFRGAVDFSVVGGAVPDSPPFRNPYYHEPTDLPPTLDMDRLARVVDGLEAVVVALAGSSPSP